MYWRYDTSTIATVTVPLYTSGTDYDVTLTLVTEAGEALNDAYLFVPRSALAGLLQAKLTSEETYRAVQGIFDANCFLGYIPADTGNVN